MKRSRPITNGLYYFVIIATSIFLFVERKPLAERITFIFQSPCERQILYRIGTVDPQFNLSSEDFTSSAGTAATLWNDAENKSLFVYDPQATLTINLIYDSRQSALDRITQLEIQITSGKNSLDSEKSKYEMLVSDFQQRLAVFNQDVAYWNNRGGAPQNVYNTLVQKQQSLKTEADTLNALGKTLNLSVEDYNEHVEQLSQNVENYNEELQEKPEEGIYISTGTETRIDIYVKNNQNELVHTLAHELGHALSLDHINDNTEALMYPLTSETLRLTQQDAQALSDVCQHGSVYETIKKRFVANIQQLISLIHR